METGITADKLNERGCINLLCAMVKQMSKDFRYTYSLYLKDPKNYRAFMQYNSIRNEFLSDYFMDLTNLNGKKIVSRLEEIVRKCIRPDA